MNWYADILLPLPLERNYTYALPRELREGLRRGCRVAVPFGSAKLYTGLVLGLHQEPPAAYEAKEVYRLLDTEPLVTPEQLRHWEWVAQYYMCTLGEVFRSAVPSVFLLQSETRIKPGEQPPVDADALDDEAYLVMEALERQPVLSIAEISGIVDRKNTLPLLGRMLREGWIRQEEKLVERFVPKKVRYIRLAEDFREEKALEALLSGLSRAPKQAAILLQLFQLQEGRDKPVKTQKLLTASGASRSSLRALMDKGVLEEYFLEVSRLDIPAVDSGGGLPQLTPHQKKALGQIREGFRSGRPALLHGITSSGKTEVYARLISEELDAGRQVLYLVPEIAITEQLVRRLQRIFGAAVAVFHSRMNLQERAELWHRIRDGNAEARLLVGARSALFLPFADLGLVIVDEEHENTFKQFDPAPRYHARDAAVVLATYFKARVLLGSATPSIESYHNAMTGKYALTGMQRRFGDVLLPEMELVDLGEQYRKKKLKGHFSERLRDEIRANLDLRRQVILFQNRRGFAPIVECTTCGHAPQCHNCDVSLTFHKHRKELRCHYCGYHRPLEPECAACGNPSLDTKGFGTEQVESELRELFPQQAVRRMDLDTTRGKYGFQKIIHDFEAGEIDILVGTQMLTKGLDFRNVGLVGIMNADSLLNFPHFRAHERCFQLLTQVAGRAGRTEERGRVLIQTYHPHHQILQQVAAGDYKTMYQEQVYQREQFGYPPSSRLIKITFRHKEYNRVVEGAAWFGRYMRQVFGKQVLGPEFPPIARIRNQYHKNILLKIPKEQGLSQTKNSIKRIQRSFNAISRYRSIRLIYNVDYI